MNHLRYVALLFLLGSPSDFLSAQTNKLDEEALSAIEIEPEIVKPKFIPKSASKGPVVEKKRNYIFTSKGTQSKAARVISMSDGARFVAPLVDIPLLFKKNSAILADAQSQKNLKLLATKLTSLSDAKFCIEGHASAEGENSKNQKLSEARAQTIRFALEKLGVPTQFFTTTIGLGSEYALYSATAPETKLAQDRRVLVIREK